MFRYKRCIRVRLAFSSLDPARLIIVNSQQINGTLTNDVLVSVLHSRQISVFGQQLYQKRIEFSRHGRVQERTVEVRITDGCGANICRVLAARIGRRQVQDDTDLATIALFPIRLDYARTGQESMIADLHRFAEIQLIRIVEIVQIAALYRYDRLIVGEPFTDTITEELEADVRIFYISIHSLPVHPATLLL
ncbi:hypothetical protein D1872_215880 [compost metagenome]